MQWRILVPLGVFVAISAGGVERPSINGFVIDDPLVPAEQLHHGGPPRDGIPSIDSPRFVAADAADFLLPKDRVLGIEYRGIAKAYPIHILNRHEIVNDKFHDHPLVVTWCPLCGSGAAFDGQLNGERLEFGVSGLLYNSDVLLYDRQTESLWSQIMLRAINGPLKGESLALLPMQHTSWQNWRENHPDTLVLSTDTGFPGIDYRFNPYAGYGSTNKIYFPVASRDKRLPSKEWVLGVFAGSEQKAYPLRRLEQRTSPMRDMIGTQSVLIEFDPAHQTAAVYDHENRPLQSIQLYWFAWTAFYPDTQLFDE
ncbi:MAG: DUF3179 domain-containing protein [Gammaproteobacteria bacterium]|nr:DUF3179 domain-containing protein [Gammaproteobacteria bacterium]